MWPSGFWALNWNLEFPHSNPSPYHYLYLFIYNVAISACRNFLSRVCCSYSKRQPFVIHISLLHPCFFLTYYDLCFSMLVYYYFQVPYNLKISCTWSKQPKTPPWVSFFKNVLHLLSLLIPVFFCCSKDSYGHQSYLLVVDHFGGPYRAGWGRGEYCPQYDMRTMDASGMNS